MIRRLFIKLMPQTLPPSALILNFGNRKTYNTVLEKHSKTVFSMIRKSQDQELTSYIKSLKAYDEYYQILVKIILIADDIKLKMAEFPLTRELLLEILKTEITKCSTSTIRDHGHVKLLTTLLYFSNKHFDFKAECLQLLKLMINIDVNCYTYIQLWTLWYVFLAKEETLVEADFKNSEIREKVAMTTKSMYFAMFTMQYKEVDQKKIFVDYICLNLLTLLSRGFNLKKFMIHLLYILVKKRSSPDWFVSKLKEITVNTKLQKVKGDDLCLLTYVCCFLRIGKDGQLLLIRIYEELRKQRTKLSVDSIYVCLFSLNKNKEVIKDWSSLVEILKIQFLGKLSKLDFKDTLLISYQLVVCFKAVKREEAVTWRLNEELERKYLEIKIGTSINDSLTLGSVVTQLERIGCTFRHQFYQKLFSRLRTQVQSKKLSDIERRRAVSFCEVLLRGAPHKDSKEVKNILLHLQK